LNLSDKKIVIVRTSLGHTYADYIAKEINLEGIWCGVTNIGNLKTFLKKHKCSPEDTIIHTRTAHPQRIYSILKNLEKKGYRVINSAETIKLTSEKYTSSIYAKSKNIPCAETLKVSQIGALKIINDKIALWGKIIVKPLTSQGQGQFCYLFDKKNLNSINNIKNIKQRYVVVQQFIEYQRLNRVLVIGFKALNKAAVWDSPTSGWKCSVCLNPNIKYYKNPPKELLALAENIAKKFRAEVSFIDIFTTKKGFVLNEINTACNLQFHERITKYNISKKIAKYLLEELKKEKIF